MIGDEGIDRQGVVLVVSFVMKWFRNRRQQPAYAGAEEGYARSMGGSVPPTV